MSPFMPIPVKVKFIIVPVLAIIGESCLWISILIGGKVLIKSIKKKISLKRFIKRS